MRIVPSLHTRSSTEVLTSGRTITGHDELQARVHDYQSLYGIFKKPWNDRDLLKRVAALITVRQSSAAPQADRGRAGATLPLGSLSS